MYYLDSHVHFWNYNAAHADFDWIDSSMSVIQKSFLPNDFVQHTNGAEYHCIAVQAAQTWQETEFLLDLAEKNECIKGVVGWIDILNFKEEFLSSKPTLLKGFRHILQAEPPGYMLQKKFVEGVKYIGKLGFTYDILIKHHQLEEAYQLVKQCPTQKFVIDHLAKPDIKSGNIAQWKKDMANFTALENVYCKVSGMVTEADLSQWKMDDFVPYLEVVFNTFGVHRIMYGSDWPVCLLGGSYEDIANIVKAYIGQLSMNEQQKIMGENAANFYSLT